MTLAIKIINLEKEYNSKFEDIVKSYAEGGHSKHDTAKMLGITDHAFNRLVKEMGWDDWFPKYSIAMKQAAEDRKYKVPVEAQKAFFKKHAYEYKGVTDTTAGHAKRLGITYSQARYRRSIGAPLDVEPSKARKDGYWSWS